MRPRGRVVGPVIRSWFTQQPCIPRGAESLIAASALNGASAGAAIYVGEEEGERILKRVVPGQSGSRRMR